MESGMTVKWMKYTLGEMGLKATIPHGRVRKSMIFLKRKKKKDGDRKGELERDVLTPRSKNESATGRERDTEMEVMRESAGRFPLKR